MPSSAPILQIRMQIEAARRPTAATVHPWTAYHMHPLAEKETRNSYLKEIRAIIKNPSESFYSQLQKHSSESMVPVTYYGSVKLYRAGHGPREDQNKLRKPIYSPS